MLDFVKIKADLETSFNKERADGVDIDINVNVISETNGKFSVSVFEGKCTITDTNLPKADITVGFVDKDTMIEMFTKGKDPVKLVMGGKMTFNGDMSKGKALKGLFVGEE
jgi:putative sterol carrier protein|tara:strand:+ start:2573 stop:2902 length:330 start_codon:yes stop_codon:yes gene_type:complete